MGPPVQKVSIFIAGMIGFWIAMYAGFVLITDRLNDRNDAKPTPAELHTAQELRKASNELVDIMNILTEHIHSGASSDRLRFQQTTALTLLNRTNTVRQNLIYNDAANLLFIDVLATADRLTASIQNPGNRTLHESLIERLDTNARAINRYITQIHAEDQVADATQIIQ
jgi:hypothetical protein